jgi:hypothetical protein
LFRLVKEAPVIMSFWNNADFAFQHHTHDSINDEIWRESAEIHKEKGFNPVELATSGTYGAQQAMLCAAALPAASTLRRASVACLRPVEVLPWVPDVLGSEWDHAEAIHIVGMAYAGFIKGISDRDFPLEEYVKASKGSWRDFAQMYVSLVICGDQAYYEPLCPILDYFGSKSRLCLFDLCRASLVKRSEENANRKYRDKPPPFKDYPHACPYCEHPKSQRWTWERLRHSKARVVIALGQVVEHGLLNLFRKQKQCVWDALSCTPWHQHPKNSMPPLWTKRYADARLKLGARLQTPTFWRVGPSMRKEASWHVIPIYHPTAAQQPGNDPGYEKTVRFLSQLRAHGAI